MSDSIVARIGSIHLKDMAIIALNGISLTDPVVDPLAYCAELDVQLSRERHDHARCPSSNTAIASFARNAELEAGA